MIYTISLAVIPSLLNHHSLNGKYVHVSLQSVGVPLPILPLVVLLWFDL